MKLIRMSPPLKQQKGNCGPRYNIYKLGMDTKDAIKRKSGTVSWARYPLVECRQESVISVWNRNGRPTHIEVSSVCTADAAIQSNPIPMASRYRRSTYTYIWTNPSSSSFLLDPVAFLSAFQYNFASRSNRRKFHLIQTRAIFTVANDDFARSILHLYRRFISETNIRTRACALSLFAYPNFITTFIYGIYKIFKYNQEPIHVCYKKFLP